MVFLFLQSYKDLIAKIEELKNKDEETKSLYDFVQNKFFIEELQITDVKLIFFQKLFYFILNIISNQFLIGVNLN